MLQSLPAAVYTCDAQGRVTFFNRAAADLWGREPKLGKDLWCGSWRIFTPDGAPIPLKRCPMALALTEGRAVHGQEIVIERPDGSKRNVLPHPEPIRDSSGAITGAINMLVDITGRKQAELALAEFEARARLALDVAGQGTWSWELETEVMRSDARCREICGFKPRGSLKQKDLVARVHPADGARIERALAAALSGQGDGRYAEEFRFVHPDGAERWVVSRGQTRFTGEGAQRRASLLLGTVLDITERKRIEQALNDNDRRKDEFLATLAHELRNPLAPLRNSLQILRLTGDAKVAPLHDMMDRQLNHMVRLVDDLLEVSRISCGKIELKPERLELGALLNNVLETAQPLVEAAGHRLTVTVPSEPLVLNADPVRLAQVFNNLLNNAVKYTEAGGRIWLTVLRDGNQAEISVRDDGAGIPPDMLARVFEMFTQVDRTLNRAQGGLGIGLSLARSLVAMHGGRIEARSDGPGKGSTFIAHLPLAQEMRNAESRMRLKKAAAGPAALRGAVLRTLAGGGGSRSLEDSSLPARAPGISHSVLVVDDNRDAADSLGLLLKFLVADVQTVYSGAEALAALEQHQPDSILLDLGMPGMDGFELARRVRAKYGDRIRLIALTGWGQEQDRSRTFEAGFDHHLTKPPDLANLQALLGSLDRPIPHFLTKSGTGFYPAASVAGS